MDQNQLSELRKQLLAAMDGSHAHAGFDSAVKGFPAKLRGTKPHGFPHSAWELLEHIRIAQWDILEFSRSAEHKSPKWPDEYWPKSSAPASDKEWEESVAQIKRDHAGMRQLIENAGDELFKRLPHGEGQTLLREALLIANHNSYHLGQLMYLRKALEHEG